MGKLLIKNQIRSKFQLFELPQNKVKKRLSFPDIVTSDQTKTIQISFDDVIGLEDAKEALEDAIILPLKHPDIYAQQNNGKLKKMNL
jgi:SpoVK/Ycf46/Vps4 family AAA+-type ATPase